MPGQQELHFKKEKPLRRRALADAVARLPVEVAIYSRSWHRHDERARQACMGQLAQDLERTLRTTLGPHPSASLLVYEHVDSTSESLLWIADIVAWCFGAGRDWRKRIDPIVSTVVDLN